MSLSVYPISRFLERMMRESGLRRSQFVQALGFRNITKGLRRLDVWIECGRGDQGFLERIVAQYHPDPAELHTALAETEAVHRHEHQEAVRESEELERRRFKPFVWVVTEEGPHSWVMVLAERQVKFLRFHEGFDQLSSADQLTAVQQRAREHYQETGGRFAHFGAILGYRFCDSFDTSIILDLNGQMIETSGRFLRPEVWLAFS